MCDNYKRGDGEMDLVATHQRSIVAAAMRTTGPMLELGVGWYSTPLLHEISEAQQRPLETVDNNMDWLAQFMCLNTTAHQLKLIGWWGGLLSLLNHKSYGFCFVDQGQPADREYTVRSLLDRVDVFVFHDTEEGPAYGYNRVLPLFEYQWTDKCQQSWTTIASNKTDVSKWMIDLPPVVPTKEIT